MAETYPSAVTFDLFPEDGRRVAATLQRVLSVLESSDPDQPVRILDKSDNEIELPALDALRTLINDLNRPTRTNRKYDRAWAIVREDFYYPDTRDPQRFTVKTVVWDADFAEEEVRRLNRINADKDVRYSTHLARIERRSREIEQFVGSERRHLTRTRRT